MQLREHGTTSQRMRRFIKQTLGRHGYELHRKGFRDSESFQPFVEKVSLAGVEFSFWVGDNTGVQWYDPAEHKDFAEHVETARLVRPGDRVLEIGSHHGFMAMLLSQLVGKEGFVLAVEPSPFNAMMASAQVGLNAATNCRIMQAAASDRKGTTKISFESNAAVTDSSNGIDVPTVTADELDTTFGPFDVLKIDVEGFEGQVLAGASALLRRSPRIILELHSPHLAPFGSTIDGVLRLLGPSYRGTFVTRRERDRIHPFPAQSIPADDIVNLFLQT
jgi:FkbM family methyltransferase